MPTDAFIIDLSCRVDDRLGPAARGRGGPKLVRSELVTIGLLFAIKGGSGRAFYLVELGAERESRRGVSDDRGPTATRSLRGEAALALAWPARWASKLGEKSKPPSKTVGRRACPKGW